MNSFISNRLSTKCAIKRIITNMTAWHIVMEVIQKSLDPLRHHFLPKRYLHDLEVINHCRNIAIPEISILNTLNPILRTPLGGGI